MIKKKYQPLITPSVQWTNQTLTNTFGECVAQPLESGFGVTFGNALRRVLLGGIEGCAVTSVIINGVNNEFSSLHGVVEDTLNILLNIKQLVIKNTSGLPGVMRLDVSTSGPVTAASITTDEHLQIINKDLVIATLAQDGHLVIDFFVECGRGYKAAAWTIDKPLQEDGRIYIDATFAPVRNVTFEVQKTRIGKDIDYDKLVLSITTDGTESPVEVLTYAVSVIRNQCASFLYNEEVAFPLHSAQAALVRESSLKSTSHGAAMTEAPLMQNDNLSHIPADLFLKPIDVLGLPARAHNCLASSGVHRVIDLVNMTEHQVVNIKNFGKKSYDDLVQIMKEFGLSFDMHINEKKLLSQ